MKQRIQHLPQRLERIRLSISRSKRPQDYRADYSGQDEVEIWMQGRATRIDLLTRGNLQRRTMGITEMYHPLRRRQKKTWIFWPIWWREGRDGGRLMVMSCFVLSPESDHCPNPIRIEEPPSSPLDTIRSFMSGRQRWWSSDVSTHGTAITMNV